MWTSRDNKHGKMRARGVSLGALAVGLASGAWALLRTRSDGDGSPAVVADRNAATESAATPRRDARPAPPEVGGRANNFDGLRLAAAFGVLASHSFAVSGADEPKVGADTLGTISVLVFFTISGFLIAQSWLRGPRVVSFAAKRALRIMPALIGVLVLTALVLGPLLTTLAPVDYFSNAETWRYIFDNARFATEYDLPGVFAGNPISGVVNGSLWTLPAEMHAYVMVALLGLAGALRSRVLATVVLAGICLAPLVVIDPFDRLLGDPYLIRAFALGTLLLLYRDVIPWRGWIAAVGVVVWVAGAQVDPTAGRWLAVAAIAYATIFVAYRTPLTLGRLTAHGDVSYGFYLYAYPVQQTIVFAWSDIPPLAMIALAAPITYLFAAASWHLIERPALGLKSRLPARAPRSA